MDSILGVKMYQNLFVHIVLFTVTLMINWREKRLCLEEKMVIDRILKLNGWVLNMEQDRGLYWGNQYLE